MVIEENSSRPSNALNESSIGKDGDLNEPSKDYQSDTELTEQKTKSHEDIGYSTIALIEKLLCALVVCISISAITLFMEYSELDDQNSATKQLKMKSPTPEHIWQLYDIGMPLEGDLCQNFLSDQNALNEFLRRPYQAVGDPCKNYYNLVCAGICNLVPEGRCFKDIFLMWYNKCASPIQKVGSFAKSFTMFYKHSEDIPKPNKSSCSELLKVKIGADIRALTNENATLFEYVINRIQYFIVFLNKQPHSYESLMYFESFCLAHCCHLVDGHFSVEFGRLMCHAAVIWRMHFSAYHRCFQDQELDSACSNLE